MNKPFGSVWAAGGRGALWVILLAGVVLFPGCLVRHLLSKRTPGLNVAPGEQPDKILLQKALVEFKHNRYTTGRLLLQSLINTYPDSEFLSQAKLAIADSYYKQGGVSGYTEAEAEYKDFITFFPTAPEAPEAEYRAGMCHFRLMGTADRDPTEAQDAETEFKLFLTKYPENPLMPEVKVRLREVQEILARGEYQIAMFYYERFAYPAAESRFMEIANKYPNFSRGDHVFWYLAQSLTKLNRPREAVPYYDRLIMEFPLSPLAKSAGTQLASLHKPVPKPTKAMLARAEADAAAARRYHETEFQKAFSLVMGTPNFDSTLHGPVVLGSPNVIQMKIAQLNGQSKPAKPAAAISSSKPLNASSANLTASAAAEPDSTGSAAKADPAAVSSDPPNTSAKKPADSPQARSVAPAPEKKKGLFAFLKKIVP